MRPTPISATASPLNHMIREIGVPFREIHTARLHLVPASTTDAAVIHQHWTRSEIRRFLWDDRIVPLEEVEALIHKSQKLFREHGCGLWVARLRDAPDLAGVGGYWSFWEPPQLELMYSIAEQHWGKGLATELGGALVRYGFEELAFTEVRASVDAGNEASIRVLEKLQMAFERRAVIEGLDTLFYRLDRERWEGGAKG